jgi:hypothetical protein
MRTHHTIAGLILALAVTLTAAQTSSSQAPTPGQAASPSQTTPSTPPGTQPQASPQAPAGSQSQTGAEGQASSPSQAPSAGEAGSPTQPSQRQAGSATSGGHGPAAQPGSSTEDELQLTNEQKEKLQPIIQEEMVQIDAVRTDNSLTMEQKQAKVAQIKKDHFPKIEAILTPEQRKKLVDMQEKARQQQAPGSHSNPQQPPQ